MARQAGADQDFLTMALVGYEAQKAKIDATIRDIQAQLGHRGPGRSKATADSAVAPAKRVLSASARRKIAAAQRKRWAAVRKDGAAPQSTPKKAKRKLSAAGRAAIVAALKKRWAAKKAAKKS